VSPSTAVGVMLQYGALPTNYPDPAASVATAYTGAARDIVIKRRAILQ